MNGWIIAYLIIQGMSIAHSAAKDGEYIKITFVGTLIAKAVILGILWMGGVFG